MLLVEVMKHFENEFPFKLGVAESNKKAQGFFKKFGFKITDEIVDFSVTEGISIPVIIMKT